MRSFPRLLDPFTTAILLAVLVASLLPAHGLGATLLRHTTTAAIALMFFLYGARLPRRAIAESLLHWRLHLTIFLCTYTLFPLIGLATRALPPGWLPPPLALGVLFLTTLPSTVQSSIAFTSIAGGNVAAAITSASLSNLAGVFITPLLVGLVMAGTDAAAIDLHAIRAIATELLLPFALGQLLQPQLGAWAIRHKATLSLTDRGSILLIVYAAFSDAVIGGLWRSVSSWDLAIIIIASAIILALVMGLATFTARRLGFSRADEIAIVFCGSKKSLATGVPMANVLFPAAQVGMLVLPLMLFHQLQLMVCAVVARRYAHRSPFPPSPPAT